MRCTDVLKLIKEAEESNDLLELELTDILETTGLGSEFNKKVRENIEYILKRDCLWSDRLEVVVLPNIDWDCDGHYSGSFELFDNNEMVAKGEFTGHFLAWDENVFTNPQIEGIEIMDLTLYILAKDAKKLFLLSVKRLKSKEKARILVEML